MKMKMEVTALFVMVCCLASFHSVAALRCQGNTLMTAYGRAWLETVRVLPSIEAKEVQLVFCEKEPVYIQLYEEVGDGDSTYRLVWQQLVEPSNSDLFQVKAFPLDQPITLKTTHRVAVYAVNTDVEYVPVTLVDNGAIQLTNSEESGPIHTDTVYAFRDIMVPGEFHVHFCGGSDCSTGNEGNEPDDQTPEPTLPPPEYQCKPDKSDTATGIEGVLLEKGRSLTRGVVKALKTYFCADSPVTIQLYRPSDDGDSTYTLVWEKEISSPLRHGEAARINFEREEYINIEESHRLAVKASKSQSEIPIPFWFNEVATIRSSETDIDLCSPVQFDNLNYPMDFRIEFCNNLNCADDVPGGRVDRTVVDTPCSGGSSDGGGDGDGNSAEDVTSKSSTPSVVVTDGPGGRPPTEKPKVSGSKGRSSTTWQPTSLLPLIMTSFLVLSLQQYLQ